MPDVVYKFRPLVKSETGEELLSPYAERLLEKANYIYHVLLLLMIFLIVASFLSLLKEQVTTRLLIIMPRQTCIIFIIRSL